MTLDPASIAVSVGVAGLLSSAGMFALGQRHRAAPGYDRWALGLALHAVAIAAFGLRPLLTDTPSILITNAFWAPSLVLILSATLRLRGERGQVAGVAAVVALLVGMVLWFHLVDPFAELRVLLTGAAVVLTQTLLVLEVARAVRAEPVAPLRLLMAAVLIAPIGTLARLLDGIASEAGFDPYLASFGNVALFTAEAAFMILSGIAMIGVFEARVRRELELTRDQLHEQARSDALTGLANRRAFAERLQDELDRARRYDRPLALVALDLDRFKQINDAHGHAAGDAVLAHVGELLRDLARSSDLVARVGGEEFAVLLGEADASEAAAFAERVRVRTARQVFDVGRGDPVTVTISAGVAQMRVGDDTDDLIGRADAALYRAKAAGRDRVMTD